MSEIRGKNFLITGGSGFLGVNLVRYLLEKEANITILDIVPFDYSDVTDNVNIIIEDIRNLESLKNKIDNIDFIVHTAAALPLYSKEDIYTTDIFGTRNILDLALYLDVDRFIHISSTAVYGIPDHHPIFEFDRLSGVGPYGKSKIIAERLCTEYREKGLCVSILRPKSFIGPERLGVFAIYFDWIRSGRSIPIVGSGQNLYQLLDVEDLCNAIFLCVVKDKERVNDIFNIGAKEFGTMAEDFGSVINYAGHDKKIIATPANLVIFFLRSLELLKLSPLYKWVYETAAEDSFVSIEKAENILDFKPKYSNKDSLIRTYEWYLSNFEEYKDKTGVSHRVPWKEGILSLLKRFF